MQRDSSNSTACFFFLCVCAHLLIPTMHPVVSDVNETMDILKNHYIDQSKDDVLGYV